MVDLPKVYTAVKTVGKYTIAYKRSTGLFYIFDEHGGINMEDAFTSLDRAELHIPSIDHMTKFTAKLARY